MCGICGLISREKKPDREQLKAMSDVIYHRGPDDDGIYADDTCGLSMRRLAIIDLVTGEQPIHNEDKTIWTVLNGEIYNFLDLREQLEKKGHKFYTKTDSETIVHLYEEYGEKFVEHLWGMFGLALWDSKNKKLVVARDRVGKKPMFYWQKGSDLVFGSEIKSILLDERVDPELDPEALYHFLTLQYVPRPLTIFKGIKKLPPAHYLVWENDKIRIERFWSFDMSKKIDCSYEEAKERFKNLLMDAVKIRMISDVPLGAFLSGGIDSSLVVGLMARQSPRPIKTFTICFEEEEFNERPYAKIIADMFSTDHHEIFVKPDAKSIFEELIWHFDEPFGDSSAIPSYFVAQAARKHITVALNGDGGDDSFGGYSRYYFKPPKLPILKIPINWVPGLGWGPVKGTFLWAADNIKMGKLNYLIKRFYDIYCRSWESAYPRLYMSIFGNMQKQEVISEGFRQSLNGVRETESMLEDYIHQCDSQAKLDKLLNCDFNTYLPGDLLVKMDRMTMAHSLEGRSPFLDHRIVEFAASLPAEWKGKDGVGKRIIRETFPDILVDEIANRPKMGFGVPLVEWFRGDLKDFLTDTIDSEKFHQRGYFNKNAVRKLLDEHISGQCNHYHRLWLLLVFELWHRMFLDEKIYKTRRWEEFKKR